MSYFYVVESSNNVLAPKLLIEKRISWPDKMTTLVEMPRQTFLL